MRLVRLRRALLALVALGLGVVTSGCASLLATWPPGLPSSLASGCPWERDPARCLRQDFPGYEGALGISDALASEREADAQARADAIQKLVAQILGVDVVGELHVVQVEETSSGGTEYRAQVRVEGRYAVDGSLPGFELLRRSVQRDRQGRYTVRALVGVRDPDRVRRAFFGELVSALSASRARLEGYVRSGDFPPEAFVDAAEQLARYIEAVERLQARFSGVASTTGGLSRNLAADRAFLAEARQAFERHYQVYIDQLVARDQYGLAVETALLLHQATQDAGWQRRADALLGDMVRRAQELWRRQAFDAALAVLTIPDRVKRYLAETQPARLAEIVTLSLRIQETERQERRRPPTAPLSLTASVEERGIRLSWQPGEQRPVAGYRIYRAQAAIGGRVDRLSEADFRLLAEIRAPDLTYVDASAVPGHAYAYRVAAVSEAGIEGRPSETRIVHLYHPVSAPSDLRVERGRDGTYTATWSYRYPSELQGYLVSIAPAGSQAQQPIQVSVPFARLGALAVDERFELRVAALRRDGQQGPWVSLTFWTPPVPPRVVRIEQRPEGIVITWRSESRQPLAAVRLYQVASPDRLIGERSVAQLAEPRWVLTDLSVGQTYSFYLTHVSAEGLESSPSETVAITPHSYPSAVEALRVTPLGGSGVLLSWKPSHEPDVVGYRIERRAEGELRWVPIGQVQYSSYVDGALEDDTRYAYRVVAINAAGVESLPATVEWLTRPRPVVEIRFEPVGDRAVVLRWTDPNRHPVSGYRVYRGEPDGSEREVGNTADPWLQDQGLRFGVEYRYRVVAWRDGLASEPTPWQSVTLYSHPARVAGLAATVLPDGSVRLSWQAGREEDLQGYRVYRQEDGTDRWVMRGATPVAQFLDKAEDGRRYRYRVTAYNVAREGEPAEIAVLTRPMAPVEVQVTSVADGVLVTWQDPNVVAPWVYRVYRGLAGSPREQLQRVGEVRDRRFVDRGALVSGVMYVYHVSAINLDGVESALSSPALFRAP